jgi:AcrR family transcriptional regulator
MTKAFWTDETPASTRRERRKQEFREKIIDAAIELFEKQGCEATKLEDICALADISKPTFYSYYPSKNELIQALGEKLWLNMAKELTSSSLANPVSTRQYIEDFFAMTEREISRYSRLERELISHSMANNLSDGNSVSILQGLTAMFATVYTEGLNRGDVSSTFAVDFLAETTMGAISAVMMNWASDSNYPIEQRLRLLGEFIPKTLELK